MSHPVLNIILSTVRMAPCKFSESELCCDKFNQSLSLCASRFDSDVVEMASYAPLFVHQMDRRYISDPMWIRVRHRDDYSETAMFSTTDLIAGQGWTDSKEKAFCSP